MNYNPRYKVGDIIEIHYVNFRNDEVKLRFMVTSYSPFLEAYRGLYSQTSSGWDGQDLEYRELDAKSLDKDERNAKFIGRNDLSLLTELLPMYKDL